MTTAPLSPAGRAHALAAMAEQELDVLVIGGGVTGAGCALDAVTRGLTVGLVEARDFAAGTSSRSTKLFHGGLRYLEQLNFPLVFEALKERSLVLNTLCPHLARPSRSSTPSSAGSSTAAYVGLGIGVYDVMGCRPRGPRPPEHLGRKKALESFPSGRRSAIKGAIRFYEGQVDDARHTMMIARTAAQYGALCANSARVVGFLREDDRVVGARVATWSPGTSSRSGPGRSSTPPGCGPTRSRRWSAAAGSSRSGRPRACTWWCRATGSTPPRASSPAPRRACCSSSRGAATGSSAPPTPTGRSTWPTPPPASTDIDYLLDHANSLLARPAHPRRRRRGLRRPAPAAVGRVRLHQPAVPRARGVQPGPGLTVIAGGKYTTYRVMAKDAVDAAVHGMERKVPRSCTERIPLAGADGYLGAWNSRQLTAARTGLRVRQVEHLLGRYGTLMSELLDLIAERPELAEPLAGAPEYLKAEACYAASHEGALHLEDVLTRRTRISIEVDDRGHAAAQEVADLVAPVLGWDEHDVAREVEHYRARVEAERESQHQPDDLTADAARLGAPDVRVGASDRV